MDILANAKEVRLRWPGYRVSARVGGIQQLESRETTMAISRRMVSVIALCSCGK